MSSRTQGVEIVQVAGIKAVTTSADDGTEWVQLPATSCSQVVIHNRTGTTLRARYCSNDGTGRSGETYLLIADGIAQPFRGLSNAKQIQVQRHDQGNTPVTAQFVFELP